MYSRLFFHATSHRVLIAFPPFFDLLELSLQSPLINLFNVFTISYFLLLAVCSLCILAEVIIQTYPKMA